MARNIGVAPPSPALLGLTMVALSFFMQTPRVLGPALLAFLFQTDGMIYQPRMFDGKDRHTTEFKSGKMTFEDARSVYERLNLAWSSGDMSTVGELLPKMKILLLNLTFLPTGKEGVVDAKELLLARDTLEIGALWSIETKNIPAFQRYVAQLKCYYFDFSAQLPDSPYKYQILGLNLLSLLAQNRLAEFHTEMELLSVEEQHNIYIKHPIILEQFLMEGSFHRVFLSKGNVPAQNYTFFINMLMDTIRREIASCVEKAYAHVSKRCKYIPSHIFFLIFTFFKPTQMLVEEASKVLMFDSLEQLLQFAEKRSWLRDSTARYFTFSQEKKKEDLHFIGNTFLICQELGYARELEKIV